MSEEAVSKVLQKFSDGVEDVSTATSDAVVRVDISKWKTVAAWLAAEAGFGFLADLCGMDYLDRDPRFEIVYSLLNMSIPGRLRVRVGVPDGAGGDPPKAPSVTGVWPGANWFEREVFDMFGVTFEGHPDLRRILMPDEWEGHPLRKDYAVGKVPVEFKRLSPGY
jgi:NADH-quinone oxidoreductase subunit C